MKKENLLISSCLCGNNLKYNGGNNYHPLVEKLKERYNLIKICPEVMGGLLIPRSPSEIRDSKVYTIDKKDVTINFKQGALNSLKLANKYNCKKALLKDKSPSCGSNYIYDGAFTDTKVIGQGMTAKLLHEAGIKLYSELDIERLLDYE